MDISKRIPFIQANYDDYPVTVEKLRAKYFDYPRAISIETQVKCNAKCSFCPYPKSPRQGQVMPDELFHKIINDLGCIPRNHRFMITLHRINEPLLDRRMQGFCQVIAEKVPSAIQQFWTNGSMLNEGAFEWMALYPRANLTVSLNTVNEMEHIRMMGFGLKGVFRGLDYLHDLTEAGKFNLPVTLCAPFQNEQQAQHYTKICCDRWPKFNPAIRPFFRWMGDSGAGAEQRSCYSLAASNANQVTDYPCAQWFDLHILANGFVTKCCIDETGWGGKSKYDVRENHVLDIYQSAQSLREILPRRSMINNCTECFHLG
jgi:sulfatase maturation enzyme AslB (radical SAM superfamily)